MVCARKLPIPPGKKPSDSRIQAVCASNLTVELWSVVQAKLPCRPGDVNEQPRHRAPKHSTSNESSKCVRLDVRRGGLDVFVRRREAGGRTEWSKGGLNLLFGATAAKQQERGRTAANFDWRPGGFVREAGWGRRRPRVQRVKGFTDSSSVWFASMGLFFGRSEI